MANKFNSNKRTSLPTNESNREKALEKKKELIQSMLERRQRPVVNKSAVADVSKETKPVYAPAKQKLKAEIFGEAKVPVYREGETSESNPSPALIQLINIYLDTACNKSRTIVLFWPSAPRTLMVTHVLATLERWAHGDKQGIRGLMFPSKTNTFHPLNHLYLQQAEVINHARRLIEAGDNNSVVVRKLQAKDAFLFSMANLKSDEGELFNPSMGELIPHFFAGEGFSKWEPCSKRLLEHISAKLARRAHKKALRQNCDVIGNPQTAPDALFALDGRMSKEEIRTALFALKRHGTPEVVLINATRPIRQELRGWVNKLTRFCAQIEEVFGPEGPGILLVADEPHAAFSLKSELVELNDKKPKADRWQESREYEIKGVCSGVKDDGLLDPGVTNIEVPVPREFDVYIVDAEATRVINKLYRVANQLPDGRDKAHPVIAAANYLARLAALPCGVETLVEWLSESGVSDHARRVYSWSFYHTELSLFEHSDKVGEDRRTIQECLKLGEKLYTNCQKATPFALKLAELIGQTALSKRRRTVVVFTNAIHRRLAERFLAQYSSYPDDISYNEFSERVSFISSSLLEDHLNEMTGAQLIFAGLDDDSLRLLMTENRVPKHTAVLLTQRAGQYLRAVLRPLIEKFDEFRQIKPRMESIFRQLKALPEDQSILSIGDFVLPTFRPELTPENGELTSETDPEAWKIVLEGGLTLYRRPGHREYVYDPGNADATERGFRECDVQTLQTGDKLFIMSSDLRELVESVLKEAGVPIEHDKTFEGALRDYHKAITTKLNALFESDRFTEKVRRLRALIIAKNEKLAKELPAEQSVRHWVNLGESADTPFDQLRPQAPMKEAHFEAFVEALGFSKLEAAYYWQRVIMPIRNARRLDGRHVSDLYAYMLLQPESAIVHSNIKRQTVRLLFQKARESISIVEAVVPPIRGESYA